MVDQEREQATTTVAEQESAIEEGQVSLTGDESSEAFGEDIDMASLIDESMSAIENGQIIKGYVLKVNADDVAVDIGSKSEGLIPLNEFLDDGKDPNVYAGMEVEVMVISREGRDGLPILSRKRAKERSARKRVRQAYKNGEPVFCKVSEIIKGGFQVDVDGIRGFIPFSQMGPGARTQEDQKALLGQTIEAKILEMRNKRDLILSQRKAIEEKREKLRKETMASLKEGYWVDGVVKNLTDFGAFVDLGGVDGLLHVKDMSWGHVAHPREMVNVGDEIQVMVLSIEGDRISLGLKQKTPDPWMNIEEKFPPGATVSGAVTSLTKYGAFVRLEEGVEGLVHVSELSWIKRVRHPGDMLKTGEEVTVKVLDIDKDKQRISLSYRQTEVDPWTLANTNYPTGTIIEGEVTGMTDFGAFIRLPEGVDGMVHVSDMSWAEKVTHPKQIMKKGDVVRCKVLEIDPTQQRISLGLKQMEPDPWDVAQQKYKVGSIVQVKVLKLTEFGAFVEVEKGIEGLAHVSTLTTEKGQKPEDVIKVGDVVTMKIIRFDRANRKISLSLKDYMKEQEREEMNRFMSESGSGGATLGELLGAQMQQLMDQAETPAEEPAAQEVSTPQEEPAAPAVEEETPPQEEAVDQQEEPVQESVEEDTAVATEPPVESAVEEQAEIPAEPEDASETLTSDNAPVEEQQREEAPTTSEDAPVEEVPAAETPAEGTPPAETSEDEEKPTE
ncbi:30S ribosomal protein S1 [bacterium]|nr:30S ribosomal protein S1 [bacterium]